MASIAPTTLAVRERARIPDRRAEGRVMGWVVKTWRAEQVAAEVVAGAEREARRLARGARRERAQALAELDAMEQLGSSLLERVRRERPGRGVDATTARRAHATPARRADGAAEPLRDPLAGPVSLALAETPRIVTGRFRRAPDGRPGRRASLHDSPLAELFLPTT
jgi:hypothetical protein